ncbi:MAG TPA: O-antigen ligase family protein [Agriterribacter sp.]|nr:O-antigen ligase family protein [Agriterribacter sp.]
MGRKYIFTAAFLNFIGYYVCLMLLFYIGLGTLSLSVSIPLRLLILSCLTVFFLQNTRLKPKSETYIFLFFSLIYLIRIFSDALKGLPYYLGTSRLLLYYLSFDMIPFLLLSNIKFKTTDYNAIRKGILFSGFLFAVLAVVFFRNYIGTVGRLTSETADIDMLSPLALSYCSSLTIGVAISYWMENPLSLRQKFYFLLLTAVSVTPFFLGSSRGSLIALILPFIFILIIKKNLFTNLRTILILVLGLVGIIYISEELGSSLIERFTSTGSDIAEGNESAVRTIMWQNAFNQFVNNPIMGDRLKLDGFDIYPHNILFETLQCTGFLGFIPLSILLVIIFIKSFNIFKYTPQYSWISVLFIQCFTQNMFSGSIFSASWLMMSMAIVAAFARSENEIFSTALLSKKQNKNVAGKYIVRRKSLSRKLIII